MAEADIEDHVELLRDITVGRQALADLAIKNSVVNRLLDIAREEAIEAGRDLMAMDFSSSLCLPLAQAAQNKYRRYTEMMQWLTETVERLDHAEETIAGGPPLDEEEFATEMESSNA